MGSFVDFDDNGKVFLIDFGETKPDLDINLESESPFNLVDNTDAGKSLANTRPNQRKFRYALTRSYGYKCAVCSVEIPQLLQACHIRGKEKNGCDDWRNGIFLCLNHHAGFDNNFFRINPTDFSIESEKNNLGIEETKLKTGTGKFPHKDALKWKWDASNKK